MALWKAGGDVQIKSWNLDHVIVAGKGGGRQGRGKFIKSQILDSSFKNKSWILDHGIVEGKRREV